MKNSKDNHIYGASSNKKKLQCRLILAPVTYASGDIYFLWTYKGKAGANGDNINENVFPADGIFTKEFNPTAMAYFVSCCLQSNFIKCNT